MKSKTFVSLCVWLLIFGGFLRAENQINKSTLAIEEGRDIVSIYDQAVANLETICDDFRRIRALELMQIRDLAFPDAYEFVQSVMPVLKPIDRELLRKRIIDPADIQAHKREVETVESEIANMVALTARLLSEIEAYKHTLHNEDRKEQERKFRELEAILNNPTYDPARELEEAPVLKSDGMTELVELAKEKPEERAVDLTKAMRKLMDDVAVEMEERATPEMRNVSIPAKVLAESGKLSVSNSDVGRRVVMEGGNPVEWMFVDTWYTIGPFANPRRINLNTKFPPETVLDLSASYPGKDGRSVSWKFLQTNGLKCVPHDDEEYAIYYAHTELWFDTPMELWIAVGSDDKANVWINGLPVWISGDELKNWRANEGLRKVRFKAGRNRVLFRIENGWRETAFSLAIQVKE